MLIIIKMAAALIAAAILGNWFLSEVKKSRVKKEPWYKPYLSIPGLLILLSLTIPIIIKVIQS